VATFYIRRLPHLHDIGRPIFITWRLHDSLPPNRRFPEAITCGRAFVVMDRLLDGSTTGPTYLRMPEVASLIVDAIQYRDTSDYYCLHNFVVMPNHVHILVTPHNSISKFMHSLKRFTAREANRILGLTGRSSWQDESYDRLVRSDSEFDRIGRYIETNPVNAGLVTQPEQFPWSSAGRLPIGRGFPTRAT
jgi:REP element-mobilizing transposase RayT